MKVFNSIQEYISSTKTKTNSIVVYHEVNNEDPFHWYVCVKNEEMIRGIFINKSDAIIFASALKNSLTIK